MTRTRWFGLVITLVTLGAVGWPLTRHPAWGDSFPLSTYPMFATRRPGAKLYLEYMVATGPGGARRHVPPRLIANAEVMQAIVTVQQSVRRGESMALCRRVAPRVARDPRFAAMDTLTVVSGSHAAVAYLVDGKRGTERVLAKCPIVRAGGAP